MDPISATYGRGGYGSPDPVEEWSARRLAAGGAAAQAVSADGVPAVQLELRLQDGASLYTLAQETQAIPEHRPRIDLYA
jgi:hypothetical protein